MTTPSLAPAPGPVEAVNVIKRLNQDYIRASAANDVAWFQSHLAEDAIVILGSGRRLRKAGFLDVLKDEPRKYRALNVRDATYRVFGSFVQVDADAPWEMEDGSAGVSRYIDTYAWMDGRWLVISAQVTYLPKSQ